MNQPNVPNAPPEPSDITASKAPSEVSPLTIMSPVTSPATAAPGTVPVTAQVTSSLAAMATLLSERDAELSATCKNNKILSSIINTLKADATIERMTEEVSKLKAEKELLADHMEEMTAKEVELEARLAIVIAKHDGAEAQSGAALLDVKAQKIPRSPGMPESTLEEDTINEGIGSECTSPSNGWLTKIAAPFKQTYECLSTFQTKYFEKKTDLKAELQKKTATIQSLEAELQKKMAIIQAMEAQTAGNVKDWLISPIHHYHIPQKENQRVEDCIPLSSIQVCGLNGEIF